MDLKGEDMTRASERFAENPVENARLCLELASDHCGTCGDFHLRSVLRRMTVSPNDKIGDREEFQAMIALALSRLGARNRPINVVIVGSTDTGILAGLMQVSSGLGGEAMISNLNVTLLDQCQTPLEICQSYAKTAGIDLETTRSDFLAYDGAGRFDLILMHGVLPFFPVLRRREYLRAIRDWLAPEGTLISSTHMGAKPDLSTTEKRTHQALENLKALVASDPGVLADREVALTERLRRSLGTRESDPQVFKDVVEASAFYAAAGLDVGSIWIVNHQKQGTGRPHRKYQSRCIAFCTRAARTP